MSAPIRLTAPDLEITCPTSLFEALAALADDALPAEAAGLLLGNVSGEPARVAVHAHFVLAEPGATPWSLRLPAETWIKADWAIRQAHPDLAVVGWFHTHPGHGVFLSAQDWDLHQRKFAPARLPHASAWVLDPVRKRWGVMYALAGDRLPRTLALAEPASVTDYVYHIDQRHLVSEGG